MTFESSSDGNRRVGRLIMFKECLKYNIVPFIIEDNLKMLAGEYLQSYNAYAIIHKKILFCDSIYV